MDDRADSLFLVDLLRVFFEEDGPISVAILDPRHPTILDSLAGLCRRGHLGNPVCEYGCFGLVLALRGRRGRTLQRGLEVRSVRDSVCPNSDFGNLPCDVALVSRI